MPPKPSERQEILLRLLGAEHYRLMMAKANSRASVAAQRASTYAEELLGFADATPEAEQAAQAAEAGLARLGERVRAALPLIDARRADLADADARLSRARQEQSALDALRVPDSAGQLDADLAASGAALRTLRDAERQAEEADGGARDALAAGPRRAPLDRAREQRAERARHQAEIPGDSPPTSTRLGERSAQASAAAEGALAALESARADRDVASRAAEDAAARVAVLDGEHTRLAAVTVPGGTAELDERRAAAASAVTAAADALDEAERAESDARAAVAAAAPEAPLAQAARDLGELRALLGDLAGAERAAGQARAARVAAEDALAGAEETRRLRQAELEAARRAHVVAGLRPHLVAGEPCPVCEQPVTTLPAPLPADEVDDAAARLAHADDALAAARSAARDADAATAKADAGLTAAGQRRGTLASGLAGVLDRSLAGLDLPESRTVVVAFADAARPDVAVPGTAGPANGTGAAGGRDELLAAALAEVTALNGNARRPGRRPRGPGRRCGRRARGTGRHWPGRPRPRSS